MITAQQACDLTLSIEPELRKAAENFIDNAIREVAKGGGTRINVEDVVKAGCYCAWCHIPDTSKMCSVPEYALKAVVNDLPEYGYRQIGKYVYWGPPHPRWAVTSSNARNQLDDSWHDNQ